MSESNGHKRDGGNIKYRDDIRAEVEAAFMAGATVMEISEQFGIPHPTISRFKKEMPADRLDEIRRKKGERLDEMVYSCLTRNLETLHKQAEVVSDSEYIKRQPAGELATLYGVMADKTLRLLAATTNRPEIGQLVPGGNTVN